MMSDTRDESIHIERVSLDDSVQIEEAIKLLSEFSEEHEGPISWPAQASLPKLFRRHHAIIHLARIDGIGVGVSLCQLNLISFQGSEALNLHDLYVIPSARGQGVGRRLLEQLIREARALGSPRMTLEVAATNAAGRALYRSCGFRMPEDGNEETLFLANPLD